MAIKKQKTALQKLYQKQLNRIKQAVRRAEKRGYIFGDNAIPKIPKRVTQKSLEKLSKITPASLYKKAKHIDYQTGELSSGTKARKEERKQASQKAQETRKQRKLEKELQKVRKINPLDLGYEPISTDTDFDTSQYQYEEPDLSQLPTELETPDGYTIDPTTGEIISHPDPVHDRDKYNQKHGLDKYEHDKPKKPLPQQPTPEPDDYPLFSDMIISNFMVDISHFPVMAEPMLRSWITELIGQYGRDDVATMLEESKGAGVWVDYSVAYRKDLLLGMISDMMEYLPDASEWFKKDLAEKFEYDEDWENPD